MKEILADHDVDATHTNLYIDTNVKLDFWKHRLRRMIKRRPPKMDILPRADGATRRASIAET